MELCFLGCGSSEGIPALFCRCDVCREAREKHIFFTRSQLLIDGVLLVDFPPDTYYRALNNGVDLSDVKDVIITHSHSDHFYPEDLFMRGLASSHGVDFPLKVYGSKKVADSLAAISGAVPMGTYVHTPNTFCGRTVYPHSVEYRAVNPFEVFSVGDYTVAALPSAHMPNEPSYVYAVSGGGKSILYSTDTAPLGDNVFSFLAERGYKFDCVIYDGTYGNLDYNEGHMNFRDCAAMREKLESSGLVSANCKHIITHLSHNAISSAFRRNECAPKGFFLACDNYKLTV